MTKKRKIIIAVVSVLLTTVVAGLLWWQTNLFDFFKTPKYLFFTYLTQNASDLPNLRARDVDRLYEDSFVSDMILSWVVGIDARDLANEFMLDRDEVDMVNEIIGALNDVTIRAQERRDRSDIENQRSETTYTISHDGEELINADILLENDAMSLRLGDILDEYITIENRNLRQLAERFDIDSRDMSDRLPLETALNPPRLTHGQVQEMYSRYMRVIYDSISGRNFTRNRRQQIEVNGNTMRANAYTLTITESEMLEVVVAVLQEAQNDDELLDFIVEFANMIIEMIDDPFGPQPLRRRELDRNIADMIRELERDIERLRRDRDEDDDWFGWSSEENEIVITVYERGGHTVLTTIGEYRTVIDWDNWSWDWDDEDFDEEDEEEFVEFIRLERERTRRETNYRLVRFDTWEDEEIVLAEMKISSNRGEYNIVISTEIEIGWRDTVEIELDITLTRDLTKIRAGLKVDVNIDGVRANFEFNLETNIEFTDVSVTSPRDNVLNTMTDADLERLAERLVEGAERFIERNERLFEPFIELFEELAGTMNGGVTTTTGTNGDILIGTREIDDLGVIAVETVEIMFNARGEVISAVISMEFEDTEMAEEVYESLSFMAEMLGYEVTRIGRVVRMVIDPEEFAGETRESMIRDLEEEGYTIR
ncbi:MAG: hypothetical protein FWC68_03020 [Oscillospiraceae bacterium]|nr:hypothetical protein [Oscillospiraceae bacterium]